MVETHAAVEVSDVRQAPAVSYAGNPQSGVGLQASGSGIGQSSELSQLTTIMMSIVSRLDATVSRLDVTQSQVAELWSLVLNGRPDGAPGVSDSQFRFCQFRFSASFFESAAHVRCLGQSSGKVSELHGCNSRSVE
jgi:hypothetical protein